MSQYPAWSPAEIEFLERIAGDVPFPDVVRRMQTCATRKGWPKRSRKAILMRLERSGHRASCRHGEWLTTGGAAELLGCPGTRVEAWLRRPRIRAMLEPRRVGNFFYIKRRAWRRLANEMPRVLGGFPADALFLLLEDRELADGIAARYSRAMGDWRIRCVETGRIYRNCGHAAREHHVSRACISLYIRQRRLVPSLGLTFEALRNATD